MVKSALCVALGLVGAFSSVVAQQPYRSVPREQSHSTGVSNAPLSLTLYRPKASGAGGDTLLLHNGAVPLWLDGPQVSTGIIDPGYSFASQWVQMGFTSSGVFPPALSSGRQPMLQSSSPGRPRSSDGKDLVTDGKDSSNEMVSSSGNPVYYGGEVGFLYGRSSGNGGGDLYETYITGTVGNDKFQISAGALYDDWNSNGRSVKFRSFAVPR
jgi:hypothetical protein